MKGKGGAARKRGAAEGLDWGTRVVRNILRPLTLIAAPGALLGLLVFLIADAFRVAQGEGIRSLAAALLPLLAFGYLAEFRREELREAGRSAPGWAVFSAMI